MFKQVDILAIAAHPDDAELGCAGTLLKLHSLGYKTGIIDLTRGELGSRGSVEVRRREAAAAARVLGLEFRANLELEDGNVTVDKQNRLRLVAAMRQCRPRLVITHSVGAHPDHGNTMLLVNEAVHNSGLARIETGQERFRPDKVAYWEVFDRKMDPHVIVDISDFYEKKEKVVSAYASQLHDPASREPQTYLSRPEFLDQLKSFHRHLGAMVGCVYGEGFRLSRLPRIPDLTLC
ncbi:MAG: bacillithiol biosynthesis deacetylase BshB1 [Acidobacteria bacterium]|nr:bacillithiol biosynthesis deacetylase BshB1 [Acidobacteriota bacterium]